MRHSVSKTGTPVTVATGMLLVLALCLASLAIGSRPLSLASVTHVLVHRDQSAASIIVWQLRMPRTVLAVMVGQALAVAGVLMQALTRNPMAEPGLLGVNAGAALAVVVSVGVWHTSSLQVHLWWALAGALAGACFAAAVGHTRAPASDPTRLVLAGAALTACLGACTGIITMVDTNAFSSYQSWVVGTVADRGGTALVSMIPFVGVGLVLALALAPPLDILALGDDQARSLGVHPRLIGGATLLVVALLCGSATALAGPISFVGLVVPHVLRLVVGGDQRRLVALALMAGPVLVLSADLVGRVVVRPAELECGIVTAFIGAPVLVRMVRRGRR